MHVQLFVSGRLHRTGVVFRNGRKHLSPNSGYPEAALADTLGCRFGGPHTYFGEVVDKPWIGDTDRQLDRSDLKKAVRINRLTELFMMLLVMAEQLVIHLFILIPKI